VSLSDLLEAALPPLREGDASAAPALDWLDTAPYGPPPPEASIQALLVLGQKQLDAGAMDQALIFFEKAARSRHPQAVNMLGRAYERGWGCQRHPSRAARLFQQSARGGDGWAMFNLADLTLKGEGCAQDNILALRLYMAAAGRGVGKALNMIGLICERGLCGRRDPAQAFELYLGGSEAGDGWAALNAARCLLASGARREAVAQMRRAAEMGRSEMVKHLGDLVAAHPGLAAICAEDVILGPLSLSVSARRGSL